MLCVCELWWAACCQCAFALCLCWQLLLQSSRRRIAQPPCTHACAVRLEQYVQEAQPTPCHPAASDMAKSWHPPVAMQATSCELISHDVEGPAMCISRNVPWSKSRRTKSAKQSARTSKLPSACALRKALSWAHVPWTSASSNPYLHSVFARAATICNAMMHPSKHTMSVCNWS